MFFENQSDPKQWEVLVDPTMYREKISSLRYLTMTRPIIIVDDYGLSSGYG